MYRFIAIIGFVLFSAQVPHNAIPQDLPCPDQPHSLPELVRAYNLGQVPSRSQLRGAWVAIGFVGDSPSFNCSGVTRAQTFEWIMVANANSIEIDMIGVSFVQTRALTPDNRDSIALPVDFAGDSVPVYQCRSTNRGTLACLFGRAANWTMGVEFKKMPVKGEQRANHKVDAR